MSEKLSSALRLAARGFRSVSLLNQTSKDAGVRRLAGSGNNRPRHNRGLVDVEFFAIPISGAATGKGLLVLGLRRQRTEDKV